MANYCPARLLRVQPQNNLQFQTGSAVGARSP
eukprot:CAMPEP_0172733496 /NCGR_PEP_ID=MMETSP1074-20121228/107339_1 /TAXON_ID=2916 /ORGANISM="Ceratium fusus, Strain PA161109" /LENGTH=31 /DNA_ID= /DNA_START= /DNA_END= /DNA_ORIENTATION=